MARKEHETSKRLSGIKAPVLLLGGKYDGIAPIKNMEYLNQNIKFSNLKLYEGGHLFLVQDRQAFKDIVEWLTKIDG